MSKQNYLNLDGRAIQLFLTVFDEGSVTKAARRLGVSQSAVSHMLDKLRLIFDDALFVRSGRGIAPSSRAAQLAADMRPLLASLQHLSETEDFDPAKQTGVLTIAAAAIQRDFILAPLANILRLEAPLLDLRIINSGVNGGELLRTNRCDLLISPKAPQDGTEFIQKKLFEDQWLCFYDPSTPAPITLESYITRPHAKVVFSEDEHSIVDKVLDNMGRKRRIALRVESFSALASLMRGTDLVVALPGSTGATAMGGFASCPLPIAIEPLGFYAVWHLSRNASPFHQWVRGRLSNVVVEFRQRSRKN